MKKLLSIFCLAFILAPQIGFAQEEEGTEINLYLPIPEGKSIMGDDGNVYFTFSQEELSEIKEAYRSYYALCDFAIAAIFELNRLNILAQEQAEKIAETESENKFLKVQLTQSFESRDKLNLQLTKNKRIVVGISIGLAVLVAGAGLTGFAIGDK